MKRTPTMWSGTNEAVWYSAVKVVKFDSRMRCINQLEIVSIREGFKKKLNYFHGILHGRGTPHPSK